MSVLKHEGLTIRTVYTMNESGGIGNIFDVFLGDDQKLFNITALVVYSIDEFIEDKIEEDIEKIKKEGKIVRIEERAAIEDLRK